MLKRVIFGEGSEWFGIVGFALTFFAFLYLAWKAIKMHKEQREHLANLPLEDETEKKTTDAKQKSSSTN